MPEQPWRSGARSRRRGARTNLVPRWRPPPRQAPRPILRGLRGYRPGPPSPNGGGEH